MIVAAFVCDQVLVDRLNDFGSILVFFDAARSDLELFLIVLQFLLLHFHEILEVAEV